MLKSALRRLLITKSLLLFLSRQIYFQDPGVGVRYVMYFREGQDAPWASTAAQGT